MAIAHGAGRYPRPASGYDRIMRTSRHLALLCVAALVATGAVAQDERSRAARERTAETASVAEAPTANPARYANPLSPPPPTETRGNARYSPFPQQRPSPTDLRYRKLQGRYEMPREISIGMHRAIENAQRRHGGKVLSADRMQVDGRELYRVKLLTPSGRVRVVQSEDEATPEPDASEQPGDK